MSPPRASPSDSSTVASRNTDSFRNAPSPQALVASTTRASHNPCPHPAPACALPANDPPSPCQTKGINHTTPVDHNPSPCSDPNPGNPGSPTADHTPQDQTTKDICSRYHPQRARTPPSISPLQRILAKTPHTSTAHAHPTPSCARYSRSAWHCIHDHEHQLRGQFLSKA